MRKILFAAVFAFTAFVGGYHVFINNKVNDLSDIVSANVKALASLPIMSIECDFYSVVIKCQKYCSNCGALWVANGGYGNSGDLSGTCTCGEKY